MILKCKSKLFKDIISEVDEQLDLVPPHDIQGTPMQDSTWFSMHVDALTDIKVTDETGREHKPIKECVATLLVHDEITNKQQEIE